MFLKFCRGSRVVESRKEGKKVEEVEASVFTAAIILALQIIFTSPVNHFTIFSNSRSVLFPLDSFTPSVNPLVLSTVEWLYLIYKRGYHIEF